ncbi:MAG: FAD-dependent oxidoreductase [Desulfobacteraceae bacterium]|nr:FAD-dependent oxidoreductase [Desulfobacteraceae bacterium]
MSDKISNKYDVIIVGCGVAGSIAGAILTSMEHKNVLVLERAPHIGGRTISFRGEGIREASDYQRALGLAANTWYSGRGEPELSVIVKKRLLDGYVLEAGGRAGWYTNRGRVSYVLAAFNKPSIFYPNVGLVWFDHQWEPHKVVRGVRYGWMSEEGYSEMKKVSARLLRTATIADAEKYDRVTLKDWLEEITSNEEALEFHYALGTWHTILNDPALISAGENLKAVIISREEGVHVTHGAWSIAGAPGHRFITEGLAAVIRDNGGEIVTNATVREISIQSGKVTGVVAQIGDETIEIKAPVVVSTVPPRAMPKLLPGGVLPSDFEKAVERTINAGMVVGQFGLTKPLEAFCKIEVDPRSFYHTSILIPENEGFRGNVPLDGFTVSNIAPTMAPEGKYLAVMGGSVLDYEAHDKKKVDRVIDRILEFSDVAFPGWRSALEWMIFTVTETALCWRQPEDSKPDVVCPSVEGLYFAGDAFGKRCNEGGIEAASHSGLVCAGAITGKSYLEILPPHLR